MKFSKEISESLTLKFAESVGLRKKRGEDVLSLGLGEPDFETPAALKENVVKALSNPSSSRYSAALGLMSLRQKIADDVKERSHIPTEMKNVVITPGTKQAVMLSLMALLEPGDEVVVVLPAYVSYVPQIYIAEPEAVVKIVNLNKEDYSLDMDAIEKNVTQKTKVIIFNSPHNPTGMMIPEADQRKLFEIVEKNDAYIISDEIYDRLVYGDVKHFSIGSLEETVNRVITVNGFGKSHAITGWRIGYAIIPQQLMGKVTKLQQHINTNTTTLLQQAIDLAWPLPVDHLPAYNEKLKKRAQLFKDFLTAHPQLKGSDPKGSFFVFLNISSTGLDSNTFSSRLVDKTGVATTPGIAFGKDWDDHIRLSLAVEEDVLKEAFNRIHNFIENKLWQ